MKAVSISSSSSSKVRRRFVNWRVMRSRRSSTSSLCRLSALTYSSSLALSSALNSLISRSLAWMMRSHESRCSSISANSSCGISLSKSTDHFIATAAFCRALDSASYSSFCRRPCRLTSSLMRRSFSRLSPTMRTLVTSSAPLLFSLLIRARLSEICACERVSSSSLLPSPSPPAPSPF